jgi:hypothetical protein
MPKLFKRADVTNCKHVHVSGRACGQRVSRDHLLCGSHKHGICAECHGMLSQFEPPNGWPKGIGDF